METREYIENRLKNQIKWYDKKAKSYKKWNNFITITTIIISSGVAITALIMKEMDINTSFSTIIIAVVGFITSVLLSVNKVKKFEELHLTYRLTCEKLTQEMYLFETKSAMYVGEDCDNLLVERIESILTTEVGNWAQLNEKKES